MPHILSPLIHQNLDSLWQEGPPYSKENLYSIDGKLPPVNYDAHTIKSHSLTHIEAPGHVVKDGKTVDQLFQGSYFFGPATIIRLKGDRYKDIGDGTYHWIVSKDELKESLDGKIPAKLLLTTDHYVKNKNGFHDPNYVLTLSQEAADWLTSEPQFNLYGTSWKSTDYAPGSMERPVHKKIFKQAAILELLDLENVPEGEYFLNCFPLRIKDSSESPVTPVLFTKDELTF